MPRTDPRTADLIARDRRHLWHPFTQHATETDRLPVASASGAVLRLQDGRELIDAISSWWCCLHGHGHPRLVQAMEDQARRLDHVLFAGSTHEPAVALGELLTEIAPEGLSRVFFSDNGSTAVEVALKLAYQSQLHRGHTERRVFVVLEHSYHGDTFGAMSVGDPEPFFAPFAPFLFEVRRVPPDPERLNRELRRLGERAAGVVIEPLVQGAGGMRMHPAAFVEAAREACNRSSIPLVADEVMTGFGRTGTMFACQQAGIAPDFLCLSKGLTGGTLPLSVTLTTEEVFDAFLSDERRRAFAHGHTYTANPIGCAVALASVELALEDDVPGRLETIGARIEEGIRSLVDRPPVAEIRRCGGILALELRGGEGEPGYWARWGPALRTAAVAQGVLLRPLGDVVYAMPPACTTDDQCDRIAAVMATLVDLLEDGPDRIDGREGDA